MRASGRFERSEESDQGFGAGARRGDRGWLAAAGEEARLVEEVAMRVVELLGGHQERPLVDAAEVARRFGWSRGTVYARADELGAIRLGDGPRARLRFDLAFVERRLLARRADQPADRAEPGERPRRRSRQADGDALLPIRPSASR